MAGGGHAGWKAEIIEEKRTEKEKKTGAAVMRVLQSKPFCLLVVSAFSLVFSVLLFAFKSKIFNAILHSVSSRNY